MHRAARHCAKRNASPLIPRPPRRCSSQAPAQSNPGQQDQEKELGAIISDRFSAVRDSYQTPKYPIILAHGLLGFDELRLAGSVLPGIHYWRGITEALAAKNVRTFTAEVPPSASIEERAARLAEVIERKAGGESVNIIAHSMGGLDARYMISRLKPPNVRVLSLTTIATPHRGSAFADYILAQIGPYQLPKLYKILAAFGLQSDAFSQLTREYMTHTFNSVTPDAEDTRYFSYGAYFEPSWWSVFRQSHRIVAREEGPNDGLVSVASSQWGEYKGTLAGTNHLDLINWTNRLRWALFELSGNKLNFNAIAFYLSIADMLAKEKF